jgi:serine protease Do
MTAINQALAAIAANLSQSTVQVTGGRSGAGSGVIWQPDGLILTNAHVIRGTSVIRGTRATVELSTGQVYPAEVLRQDARSDLAALRINAVDLPAVTVGDSTALRVGELVFAIGNPLGQVGALTMGIIHTLPAARHEWLQADIRLAPGNSGGALADAQGRVIGINTMIVNGLGFAIPSHLIDRWLQAKDQPYLGITIQPVLLRDRVPRLGLLILEVAQGSPAARQLLIGDLLIGVNGQALTRSHRAATLNPLSARLEGLNPGDTIQLDLIRGGQCLTCAIVLDRKAGWDSKINGAVA